MNIIVRAKPAGAPRSLTLSGWHILVIALTVFFLLPAAALYAGKLMGEASVDGGLVLSSEWKSDIDRNRQEIERLSRKAREDLNAMSVRLAQLQAQAIRINALGQRLVGIARLDEGEFDFSQPPALGGPEADVELTREIEPPDFIRSLDQLASELDDREQRLRVLEDYFMTRNLEKNVVPAGWPVRKGWVSSYYGTRTDPFTGRRAMHHGMDFAGKEGSEVLAVASGVVTFSGKHYGYGEMVEISHGNGYITRYAHNRENLVKAGDVVEKGQAIALMGSTGRSTGPHVHFEVLKNGRGVDPGSYIRAAK
jgi:murein DD-endopeptidase MepM/ murein hydrolase activator NlpD